MNAYETPEASLSDHAERSSIIVTLFRWLTLIFCCFTSVLYSIQTTNYLVHYLNEANEISTFNIMMMTIVTTLSVTSAAGLMMRKRFGFISFFCLTLCFIAIIVEVFIDFGIRSFGHSESVIRIVFSSIYVFFAAIIASPIGRKAFREVRK